MVGLAALVGHLLGDYVLQSDADAVGKHYCALTLVKHSAVYATCVLLLLALSGFSSPLWMAAGVICSHAVIDWFRLGELAWQIVNRASLCEEPPRWLSYMCDNTLHLLALLLMMRGV
jgi:hypothetical protein